MKYKIKALIVLGLFSFSLSINALDFYEKEPFVYPEFLPLTEDEKNGINFHINLPDNYTVILDDKSRYFYRLNYDKKNRMLTGKKEYIYESIKYLHVKKTINEDKKYFQLEEARSYYKGNILFDKNNRLLKIKRDKNESTPDRFNYLILESSKYFVPEKILKINDEWEYDFKDESYILEDDNENKKRHQAISFIAKFKFLGFSNFNFTRCAVIVSTVKCISSDMLQYKRRAFQLQGGTKVYETEVKNLIFVDYKSNKVLSGKSFIKQVCKGNFLRNFGLVPEQAISNVLREYDGYVNKDDTFVKQFFYYYFTGTQKEFEDMLDGAKINKKKIKE